MVKIGRVYLAPETEEENEIIYALSSHGLNELTARLADLGAMRADDPDDPALVLGSLRSFTDFFMQEDRLPVLEIGAGPEGLLEAEWRIPENNGRSAASDDRY